VNWQESAALVIDIALRPVTTPNEEDKKTGMISRFFIVEKSNNL